MDHFINIPVDHAGVIPDPRLAGAVSDAMTQPFQFTDVFVYVHGWWTSEADSMSEYTRFSVEFVKSLCGFEDSILLNPPLSSLGIGVHWPSVLSEDKLQVLNLFEPLSYYQMERRSDDVGLNALYALFQLLFSTRRKDSQCFRLTLIGHSFGCRSLCRALNRLRSELDKSKVDQELKQFVLTSRINLVLLQAAIESEELDKGGAYGNIALFPSLRILATRSDLDTALGKLFPLAERLNILRLHGDSRVALGYAGPTKKTTRRYSGRTLSIGPGFQPQNANLQDISSRLVVADLTPLHRASSYPARPLRGHHSDIFLPEIYRLIAGFSFELKGPPNA